MSDAPEKTGATPTPEGEARRTSPEPVAAAKSETRQMPEPKTPEGPAGKTYFWGTGRRKRAIARVRVRPGTGKFEINGRKSDAFFHILKDRETIVAPLEVTGALKKVDVWVNVKGGGTTGQAGAILMGIARALTKCNSDYEPFLREHKFLSRDPRQVERKKYGQRGARRRFQFSKR